MRFRDIFLGIGSVLVIILLLLSDPQSPVIAQLPFGAGTVGLLINLTVSLLLIGLLHMGRKALADYIELEVFFKKAIETPEGAGMALIAVAVMMLSISVVIFAAVT